MNLPTRIRLADVSPRDGLQNKKQAVPTNIKVALVRHLQQVADSHTVMRAATPT